MKCAYIHGCDVEAKLYKKYCCRAHSPYGHLTQEKQAQGGHIGGKIIAERRRKFKTGEGPNIKCPHCNTNFPNPAFKLLTTVKL